MLVFYLLQWSLFFQGSLIEPKTPFSYQIVTIKSRHVTFVDYGWPLPYSKSESSESTSSIKSSLSSIIDVMFTGGTAVRRSVCILMDASTALRNKSESFESTSSTETSRFSIIDGRLCRFSGAAGEAEHSSKLMLFGTINLIQNLNSKDKI